MSWASLLVAKFMTFWCKTTEQSFHYHSMKGVTGKFTICIHNIFAHVFIFIFFRAARFDNCITVHDVMFIPALDRLGTDEQRAKWLPLARNLQIIGTYAQTEMGHGKICNISV